MASKKRKQLKAPLLRHDELAKKVKRVDHFSRLPAETLNKIIDEVAVYDDYLSRADLRSLRLSCRRLAILAASRLFETIPLWISIHSLENLAAISEHPYWYV